MIPPEIDQDFLKLNYLLGLKFLDAAAEKIYYCEILRKELLPILVYNFGSISSTSSSGWKELKVGTYSILSPTESTTVLHMFYGISPTSGRIYFRVPSDTDRYSVVGTRAIGDEHGCIRGYDSPFTYPSLITRYFALRDVVPNFNAYNPTYESQTIKMRLMGMKYHVEWLDYDKIPIDQLTKARVENIGGITLVPKPAWLTVKGATKTEIEKLIKEKRARARVI